jgi:hypothetical protein
MCSLGCVRSAQQDILGSVASTRNVHLNSMELGKNIPRGCTRVIRTHGGTSRLLNTLEGESMKIRHKELDLLNTL